MLKMIVIRKLDSLGRITLPIEMRRKLNWNEFDSIECYKDAERKDYIVLEKESEDGTGRKIDGVGRYTIPIEVRNHAAYEIFLEDEKILLKGINKDNMQRIKNASEEELSEMLLNVKFESVDEVKKWLAKK